MILHLMFAGDGGAGQKVAFSKQAADLARFNQAINNAAKAGESAGGLFMAPQDYPRSF